MALSRYKLLAKSQAVRKFTDREHARDVFIGNFLRYIKGQERLKVLTFYGAGGIGKSALLRELKRAASCHAELAHQRVEIVSLDLDADHLATAADVQYAVRRQWNGKCPLFEFALARYWEMQGRSLNEIRKQVIREDSLLFDLIEAGADLADAFAPARLIKKLISKGADFARRHGNLADRFEQLASFDEAQLTECLPAILGEEIGAWANENNRLLLFVDGHDRLLTESRFKLGKYSGDQWLQELIGAAEAGLYVIAGRHPLKWSERNSEWMSFIEQHCVGPLADQDADEFLEGIPVTEPVVRQAIVRSARGVPLYLDLCASIYLLKKESGLLVETADFEVAENEVIDRFLSHLDGQQAEAVRLLSVLDSFDQPFFGAILKDFNIAIPVTWFDDFCAISYAEPVETGGTGVFKIHECFRDHLREDVRTATCGRILEVTHTEARRSAEEGDFLRASRLLRSALPALSTGATTTAAGLFSKILDISLAIADAGYVHEITQIASHLSALPQAELATMVGKFVFAYCHRRCCRLAEAKRTFESIDRSLLATVLPLQWLRLKFHAAHVDHLLGRYADAAGEYEAIVSADVRTPEEAFARNLARRQLADIHLLQGRFNTALGGFDELLLCAPRDPIWLLECLRFRGHVLRFNFLLDDAAATYAEVLRRSDGSRIPGMRAKALVNLAEARCWNDPAQAVQDAEEGISLAHASGNVIEAGKGHTAAGIASIFLDDTNAALKHLSDARSLQNEAGYQSGNVFVAGAFALYYFLVNDARQLDSTMRTIEEQTSALGVYRFIAWTYGTICDMQTSISSSEFEWLPNSRITETLASTRSRLLHRRDRARGDVGEI